jgi:hypothetical protein
LKKISYSRQKVDANFFKKQIYRAKRALTLRTVIAEEVDVWTSDCKSVIGSWVVRGWRSGEGKEERFEMGHETGRRRVGDRVIESWIVRGEKRRRETKEGIEIGSWR